MLYHNKSTCHSEHSEESISKVLLEYKDSSVTSYPQNDEKRAAFTFAKLFSPHPASQRKCAFTLAEVLITLGIIGVVAALTLPTLIANHQKKVLKTAFNTSYSLLGQAIYNLKAETGLSSVRDYYVAYDDIRGYYMQNEFRRDFAKQLKFIDTSLSKQPKYRTYDGGKEISVDAPSYSMGSMDHALANGAILRFAISGNLDGRGIVFKVDTNGFKPPNRYGFDVFEFTILTSDDKLVGRKMMRLYSEEEAEDSIYCGLAGLPCSKKSKQTMNGIGCAGYALADECPDDPNLGYWECLPK